MLIANGQENHKAKDGQTTRYGLTSKNEMSIEPIAKVLKREEFVIPTKVGHVVKHQRYPVFSIYYKNSWIPVCTGMTTFAIGSIGI